MDRNAYVDGLKMLGRRELSEAQLRQRLAQRGYDQAAIDAAVARLRDERAIDDARVAEVIARTESSVRRRGKLRVERQLENAGIASETARRAIDEVFSAIDADALLDAALAKRMRGRDHVADEDEVRRLFRYLTRQGFEPDHVMKKLTALAQKKTPS